jgi:HTH-type transcriptional regulator/antitoxin HigA
MDIHPIRNDRDHARALKRVEKLWGARPGTLAAEELEVLATLIDAYEAKHHPIEPADPIDAILFRMEQMGLTRRSSAAAPGCPRCSTEVATSASR